MIGLGVAMVDGWSLLPPGVWWVQPHSGAPGTLIHIVGNGFSETSLVTFAGTRAEFTLAGPMLIKAKVPTGAVPGPITVTTAQGTIHSKHFFPVE